MAAEKARMRWGRRWQRTRWCGGDGGGDGPRAWLPTRPFPLVSQLTPWPGSPIWLLVNVGCCAVATDIAASKRGARIATAASRQIWPIKRPEPQRAVICTLETSREFEAKRTYSRAVNRRTCLRGPNPLGWACFHSLTRVKRTNEEIWQPPVG